MAASSSEVAAVKPKPPKEFLTALAFVRYLASLHIVVGHIKAKGFYPGCYFCSHGFTWVPFFFVLSGFVLTHARLGSRDPSKVDGPAVHFWKRSATIYPMYAVAVLGSAVIRMESDQELPKLKPLIFDSKNLHFMNTEGQGQCQGTYVESLETQ